MGQMIQASLTRRMGLRKMGRRSEPPSGRPKKRRERRSRFLIVCGGKVTEPSYFRVLKADLGLSNAVDVRPVPKDPLSVVRDAIKIMDIDRNESEREGFDRFREVWVIVDCDNFCNLQQAQAKARESGIRLVISNPCFEVWLIDHVRVCPSFSDIRKYDAQHLRERRPRREEARGEHHGRGDIGRNAEKRPTPEGAGRSVICSDCRSTCWGTGCTSPSRRPRR